MPGVDRMLSLLQDIYYTMRLFRKQPLISFVIILTIAVGIGANSAVFTAINNVILRPLAFDEDGRLMIIYSVSVPDFLDWQKQSTSFQSISAYTVNGVNLTDRPVPERLEAARVSEQYFETITLRPVLGRGFSPDDHRVGAPPVVMLEYSLWQNAFGGDAAILGKTIQLDGNEYLVVGVMPKGFQFPQNVQIFLPYQFGNAAQYNRESNFLTVIGRLKPDTNQANAQIEIATLNQRLSQQYSTNKDRRITVYSLHERLVSNIRPLLLLLQVAVAFVLLIGCANVANLLVVQANVRKGELAVRLAHGASRSRVVRQLLTECLLLSLIGCVVGLFLATQLTKVLARFVLANQLPQGLGLHVGMDSRVLLVAIGAAVLTATGFSIFPVTRLFKTSVSEVLRTSGRGSLGATGSKLRKAMAILELAVALLLLIASGLTLKSFQQLRSTNPGFDPDKLYTAKMTFPALNQNQVPRQFDLLSEKLHKIEAIPGITAASVSISVPLDGKKISGEIHIAGVSSPANAKLPVVDQQVVGPNYAHTMGIPILQGRDILESDNENTSKVALVNKTLADQYFPNKSATGGHVAFEGLDGRPVWMEIVGIVGNVKSEGLERLAAPAVYIPLRQLPANLVAMYLPMNSPSLIVRTSQDQAVVTRLMTNAAYSVDKDQPLSGVQKVSDIVSNSMAQPRMQSLLLGFFAAVSLFLAVIGVYTVLAYAVQQRAREIGLRMAFGATQQRILIMVLNDAMKMAGAGICIGLIVSFILLKALSSLLYGARTFDATIFIVCPTCLFVTSILASFLPAVRASRGSPMEALRFE